MTLTSNKSQLRGFGWLVHGVGLAVLAVGIVLAYSIVWLPMQASASDKRDRIETLSRLLNGADHIRAEHAKLTQQLADTEKRAAEMRQRIPDQPHEADFLKEITQAAKSRGLVIRDYRRGELDSQETHSQLEVRLLGEGNYKSICEFVDQVSALARISKLTRLHISTDDARRSYPIEMTFVLYFGLKTQTDKG